MYLILYGRYFIRLQWYLKYFNRDSGEKKFVSRRAPELWGNWLCFQSKTPVHTKNNSYAFELRCFSTYLSHLSHKRKQILNHSQKVKKCQRKFRFCWLFVSLWLYSCFLTILGHHGTVKKHLIICRRGRIIIWVSLQFYSVREGSAVRTLLNPPGLIMYVRDPLTFSKNVNKTVRIV